MKNITPKLHLVSAFLLVMLMGTVASAQTVFPFRSNTRGLCGRTMLPVDATANLEFEGQRHWRCENSQIADLWTPYNMVRSDWDNGAGFFAVCDLNTPLGRMLNSIAFLKSSHPDPAPSPFSRDLWGSWLRTGYQYTVRHVPLDEWRGLFERRNNRFSFGCVDPRGRNDNFIARALVVDGFKRPTMFRNALLKSANGRQFEPALRASILLHEAVHYPEGGHDGGKRCPIGRATDLSGICDQSFYSDKPYAVDTRWAEQFGHCSVGSSNAMRDRAIAYAITRLQDRFAEDPMYTIPTRDDRAFSRYCDFIDSGNELPEASPARRNQRKSIPDEERGPSSDFNTRVRENIR